MQKFLSNGVEIAFDVWGQGPPVLLIHGFGSNVTVNWIQTGWVKTLVDSGMQVIAFDNRGHGKSEKIYKSSQYTPHLMAQDALNLLRHLEISRAAIMGYSMGARIAAFAALLASKRVRCIIFGGLAYNLVAAVQGAEDIAKALLADKVNDLVVGQARDFRLFADATKSDKRALAACILATRVKLTPHQISQISCPVLVAAGALDELAGSVDRLTQLMANSQSIILEKRNHMNAVGDLAYKAAVLQFLSVTD